MIPSFANKFASLSGNLFVIVSLFISYPLKHISMLNPVQDSSGYQINMLEVFVGSFFYSNFLLSNLDWSKDCRSKCAKSIKKLQKE
jgi:hypothetical protein